MEAAAAPALDVGRRGAGSRAAASSPPLSLASRRLPGPQGNTKPALRLLAGHFDHSPPALRSWWRCLLSSHPGAAAGPAGQWPAGPQQLRARARAGQRGGSGALRCCLTDEDQAQREASRLGRKQKGEAGCRRCGRFPPSVVMGRHAPGCEFCFAAPLGACVGRHGSSAALQQAYWLDRVTRFLGARSWPCNARRQTHEEVRDGSTIGCGRGVEGRHVLGKNSSMGKRGQKKQPHSVGRRSACAACRQPQRAASGPTAPARGAAE